MSQSVGIVVPAYRPDVRLLSSYLRSIEEKFDPAEIIVELDEPRLEGLIDELRRGPADVNVSIDRRGKGAAITHGFESLETDILMFLDADGSTPVASAAAILEPVRDQSADIGVGSRRHPAAEITTHQTVARRYLGDAFAWMARRMLPTELRDYQCGAKALSAEAWQDVRSHLYERGFAWDLELVAVGEAVGYDIVEVPVTWEDRPGSTVDPLKTVFDFSRALLTVRHHALSLNDHPIHSTLPQSSAKPLVEQTG